MLSYGIPLLIKFPWKWSGFAMAIFLAGLQGIPKDYLEAAEIDGASSWHRFCHIVLPLLAPAFTINITMNVIGGFKVFEQVYVLTGGGPGNSTQVLSTYIYKAERLRLQLEESSEQTSANLPFATENTSSVTSQSVRLPSEYLLNSTVRLFHQVGQIFRDNAAAPSNPMGIRIDSKRRKKLMQKRLAMGHKQDDHEQAQGYEQNL